MSEITIQTKEIRENLCAERTTICATHYPSISFVPTDHIGICVYHLGIYLCINLPIIYLHTSHLLMYFSTLPPKCWD